MEAKESETKECFTCKAQKAELLRCTRCKNVYYCGAQCQKKDWPSHKLKCSKKNLEATEKKEDLQGMNEFHKVQHLGTGNFTTIFKAVSKIDGKTYAIKQAEKAKLTRVRKEADLFMEKHCLGKLKDCQYVVRLWKTFQDELYLFMKMDCPEGGELWDHSKFYGIIGEPLFKYYACQIIKAVQTLHEQYQIVHRDLKPENILLTKDHQIKLIDFGTARDLERPDIKGSGNGLKGRKPFEHYVGTPHYMAPECIHNKASQKISDVYSLSGLLFFLKVGSAPFCAGSEYLIFKKSLETELLLPSQLFSEQLADLVLKMNKKQMEQRLPLSDVVKHEYFSGIDFDNLPTYEQMQEQLTPFQRSYYDFCQHLIQKYSNLHKEKVEVRQEKYEKEIVPQIQKWASEFPQEQTVKLAEVIRIQTEIMINLEDDLNVSFTQLYKKLRNIKDPVIVKQLNEEELENLQKREETETETQSMTVSG